MGEVYSPGHRPAGYGDSTVPEMVMNTSAPPYRAARWRRVKDLCQAAVASPVARLMVYALLPMTSVACWFPRKVTVALNE